MPELLKAAHNSGFSTNLVKVSTCEAKSVQAVGFSLVTAWKSKPTISLPERI